MSIEAILNEILDERKGSNECDFNGYLEDHVSDMSDEDPLKALFAGLVESDPHLRIMVNYRFKINKDVIANQIIRYKDAFKVPKRALLCPYVLYGKTINDRDVVLIIYGEQKEDYLYAKGVYYSLTEQGSIFADHRNDVLTVCGSPDFLTIELVTTMLSEEKSLGALQRDLDAKVFNDNDELVAIAQDMSNVLRENALGQLPVTSNKQELIYQTIVKWYLLKKMLYVQTMVDKNLLRDLDQDIKKVRQRAKENADSLIFIPLSEMWRIEKQI